MQYLSSFQVISRGNKWWRYGLMLAVFSGQLTNARSKIITSLKCRMILFCHRCEIKVESLHFLHEAGQPMLLGFLIRVCLHFLFIQTRFGFRESTNFNEELTSIFDLFRNSDNDSAAAWTVFLLRYSRVEIACLWPCPYQCVSKTSVSR